MIKNLFRKIPSFKKEILNNESFVSSLYEDKELYNNPYTVLQDFAIFILSKLDNIKYSRNEKIVQLCFEFIGEMLISSRIIDDPDLFDAIYLGLLAPLADSENINLKEAVNKYLAGEALTLYQTYTRKLKENQPFYD